MRRAVGVAVNPSSVVDTLTVSRFSSRLFHFGVASLPVFAYLGGMQVHFSPDVETRLQQVASANGKDPEQLVKDTVARMLENHSRFIDGVQKGIEQAERGEFVEHQDVLNRIDRLFQL